MSSSINFNCLLCTHYRNLLKDNANNYIEYSYTLHKTRPVCWGCEQHINFEIKKCPTCNWKLCENCMKKEHNIDCIIRIEISKRQVYSRIIRERSIFDRVYKKYKIIDPSKIIDKFLGHLNIKVKTDNYKSFI